MGFSMGGLPISWKKNFLSSFECNKVENKFNFRIRELRETHKNRKFHLFFPFLTPSLMLVRFSLVRG